MCKRPNFSTACRWIATEDDPGGNKPVEELTGTLCVCLVADVWGVTQLEVAKRVWSMRNNPNDALRVF